MGGRIRGGRRGMGGRRGKVCDRRGEGLSRKGGEGRQKEDKSEI